MLFDSPLKPLKDLRLQLPSPDLTKRGVTQSRRASHDFVINSAEG